MKQKTNRLHFSTRTLAMVLSIVMLIGSIATGSMLNTFAAYLKDNVNNDAVSQAANEGSDIAKSAIPSQDADAAAQADNEEDKPDLSGFEENEIVRGMKDDLAYTAAKLDLAATGTTYYLWLAKDGRGNVASNYSNNGAMTANGDGTYTASFTISNHSNFAFCVCTSNSDKTSGFVTFPTTSVSVSSDLNSVQYQYLTINNIQYSFLQTNFNSISSDKTVYVTCNPTSTTMSVSTTDPSGGGTSPTVAPTEAGGDTTTDTVNGTSGKTIIISYDRGADSPRDYAHAWQKNSSGTKSDIFNNSEMTAANTTLTKTATGQLMYVDLTSNLHSGSTYDVGWLVKRGNEWDTSKSADQSVSPGSQGYIYRYNSTDENDDPYDALKIVSVTRPTLIIKNQSNSFTVVPDKGVPYFLKDRGTTSSVYKLTVGTTDGGSDVLSSSNTCTYATKSISFNYTPTASSFTLYYTLTDGIDTVEYSQTYTAQSFHDVTFSAGTGGSISPSGSVAVGESTATTVTATPSAAYNFSGWTLGDGIVCADTSSSTISITTASSGTYTVKANFTAKTTYPITVVSNNAAYGTASASPAYAYEGQTVTLTATENTGTFSSWSVVSGEPSISGNTKSATFTMPAAAVKVKAMFNAYSGTSKYYYDGWKNESAVSPGDGWNNILMTEAQYNGQRYSYFHVSSARPADSNDHIFSINYRESGDRYVYFWDNRDSDSNWANNPQAVFEDATGEEIYVENGNGREYVSGSGGASQLWKFKIPDSSKSSRFNRIAQVYFKNSSGGERTEAHKIWNNDGCFSRGDKSANDNTWYILQYDSTHPRTNSGGVQPYYWGTPNGAGSTFESDCSTARFGSDIVLSYADIGNYTDNISMIKPYGETIPKDYYIIVYYPNTNYGTINGVAANNTNAYPIVVASTDLPGGSVDTVNVYAKDGAIRPGYTTYARLGDTKIYDEDNIAVGAPVNDANGDGYETYTAAKGDTIKIKTAIGNNYANDYYVRGFLINGEVPKGTLFSGKTDDNIYEIEYTIDEDFEGKYIEVTPVYYLTDTTTNQTVSFYVDDFTPELQAIGDGAANWGNTIYAYPFYSTLHSYNNAFGEYPGQPLICYNGIYSIQIPIYDTSPFGIAGGDDALLTGTDDNKKTQRKAIRISGITLHNGFYDTVHRTVMGYKYNGDGGSYQYDYQTQTYDFDDFYKIYHEKDNIDNIVFQFKHKEYAKNTDNLHLLSSFTPSDAASFTSTFGADFEPLLNFHKRKVNIYGDAISGSALQNNPIYVVSKAGASNVENTVGHYATEWVIYKPSDKTAGNATYTKVEGGGKSSIPPSLLLLNSSESFSNTVYPSAVSGYNTTDWATYYSELASYKDCPVLITYEEAKYDVSGDKATRSDGRWLYSKNGETITSNIRIDVNTSNTDGTYVPNTSLGITGLSAYFTNAEADGQQTYTTTIDPDKTFDFKALSSNPDYIFEGWYFDNGKGITKENEGEVERTGNYTLVARFRHHNTGILMLSHDRKADADQGFLGDGTTTMSVTVYDGNGVVVKQVKDATSTITLDDSIIKSEYSAYRIMVTLSATPKGDNRFEKVILDGTTDPDVDAKFFDGNMSYTTMPGDFEFTIGDLFSDDSQIVRQLNYYSYFSAPTYLYEIKYEYTGKLFDRSGNRAVQTYIKKGTMTPAEASAYVEKDGANLIMSTNFINKIAPYEDNFGEVETWTIPGSTYRQFSAVEGKTNTYQLVLNGNDNDHKVHCTSSTEPEKKTITFELPYFFDGAGQAKFNDEGTKERTDSAYAENEAPFMTISKNYVLSVPYAKVPKPRYNTLSSHYAEWNLVPEVDDENYVEAPTTLLGATFTYNDVEQTTEDKEGNPTTETVRVYSYTPNDTQYQFQYWRIFSNKDGLEVARCYSTRFTFAALGDYTITPIYEVEQTENPTTGMAATISYLGPSRNQWNYNGWGNAAMIGANDTKAQTASDLIFEDFVCAYYYHGEKIYKGNSNVTTGYVVDRIALLDAYDDGSYNTDRKYYESKYNSSIPTSAIESAINQGQGTHGTYSVVNFSNTSLDNKDRIQNFYSVYNSVGWQEGEKPETKYAYKRFVYRAFAYIKDSSGKISLSDPVYFTMYDIATKEGIQ